MCKVTDVSGNPISKENKSNMAGKPFLTWVNSTDATHIPAGTTEDSLDLLEDLTRKLVNTINREKNFYLFERKASFIQFSI